MEKLIQVLNELHASADPYTCGHQRRAADLAAAIGRELGLGNDRVHGLRMAALVHDLGMISVPVDLLSKTSPLTELERDIVRNHTRVGYELLGKLDFPWPVADVAHQHHERLDGSGYPEGLRGDAIRFEARIIAVADVVEAMASHRPYRPPHRIEQALDELGHGRGTRYDPRAVDACVTMVQRKRTP